MYSAVAAILSAALLWASFPPLNLGFLVFVAPTPLLWAARRLRRPRDAVLLGLVFGVAFFGGMLWWIFILGAVAWIPLTLLMTAYTVGFVMLMYLVRDWSPLRWWAVAVGAWALWEFIRSRWPLGGFPWGAVGFPVGTLPGPRGATQWIGVSGWGVLVIAFAAALVVMVEEAPDRRPLEAVGALILVLAGLGALFGPHAGGLQVRVAIVQGNSPCPRVHCDGEKEAIYSAHLAMTRRIAAGSVDLVVWPEDSFGGDFNPTTNPEVRSQMAAEAVRLNAYLLAGGTRSAGPGNFDNINIVLSPTGAIVGEYMKTHPVPFGEFVPGRGFFTFIRELDAVPRDMRRGSGPVVFPLTIGGEEFTLGSVISFEGAFDRTMRGEVKAGAQLMVVATNEGSFGRGPASDQLIGMVRANASSLGVDVVHAAVTGRSTFVSAGGGIGAATGLFTEEVLYGTVRVQESGRTLYALAGDWLQLLAIGVGLGAAVMGRHRPHHFRMRPAARR
jgi:apolipoprotein N-acyltransferase